MAAVKKTGLLAAPVPPQTGGDPMESTLPVSLRPPTRRGDMNGRLPTSVLLNDLLDDAPAGQVTLDWLMSRLGDRSFGIVICLLSLLALLPGVSAFIGLLIAVPALQMILARSAPVFPKRIGSRGFRTHQLGSMICKVTPTLRYLERFIHPRWTIPFDATKRVVGTIVLVLGVLLLVPLPLSNIPPALIIMLISVAYLEQDGVLLCAAMTAAVLLLAIVSIGLLALAGASLALVTNG